VVKPYIEERALELGAFIIENRTTVRAAAQTFGISKSTVHKDVTERLRKLNPAMAKQVKKLLEENKAERHIRGGEATRIKYKKDEKKAG
jgi:putative DeoR family transcriptional regulator (stage III sporulation protein D)